MIMYGVLVALGYILMAILSGTILLAYTKIKKWGIHSSAELLVFFGGLFWPAFWVLMPVYVGVLYFVDIVSDKIAQRWEA